ncbi:MAG: ribonuclease Y [Anaerolineaceae bacterium]|nr:ribonuclease Y [Anaerolineaceae bacterium]
MNEFINGRWLIILLVDIVAILVISFFLVRILVNRYQNEQKLKADNIIQIAKENARNIELEARDRAIKKEHEVEKDLSKRRLDLSNEEDRLQNRRNDLDNRLEKLEAKEQNLNKRQSTMDRRANEIDKKYNQILSEVQRVAQMTLEEAKAELLLEAEKDARNDMARIIRQIESEARAEGDKRAREIIAGAIQRIASDHVAQITTSLVALPNEEMKGRIVGRNGRNIRAFEQAAGVDIIVDDTPEAVTVSCFDSVRREIARRALERLILDGRIHPAYIEKILKEETKEVDKAIIEAGESAAYDVGLTGLRPEITKMMGRLKYRTSYGQNQLAHAIETAKISAVIAAELGANIEVARVAGFLHDIGKAMDHDTEGTHAKLGAEFVKRHGVRKEVANAIAAHHHEEDQTSIEAIIVETADAISGARPGARREDFDQYIKRLRALEDIANSYKGVEESYAIQAGREIRIIVKPDSLDDLGAIRLSRDVAKRIEESMQYPGQIKVTVIREKRAVEYAK